MGKETTFLGFAERGTGRGDVMENMPTGIAAAWERLVAVESRDAEEARLGRLFNTLMVIGIGAVVILCTALVLMPFLGLASRRESWTAAVFPLFFIPFSIFCIFGARRGRLQEMIHLYVWVHFLAVVVAIWLFGSPAWVVFAWTITTAGILLAPAAALWVTGGVVAYFLLLLGMSSWGIYSPPFELGEAGREFASMTAVMSMLVAAVGLITYLNMRGLRRALNNLRDEIADRKQAEKSLQQSEERFRSIFEHAGDIIFIIEPDTTLSAISPSMEPLLGWSPSEWVGRSFVPIVHPEDQPRAAEAFMKAQAGQPLPLVQLRILKKGGDYLETEISPTLVHHGDSIAILGVTRDVTERKRMEEKIRKLNEELEVKVQARTKQLRQAQEELVRREKLAVLGQVAGSVGHELRNPLGVMSNAVYFLQTVLTDADESTKEYLNIIKDEIANSERIVSDLLDAVRTKVPQTGAVRPRELIDQVLQKFSVPPSVTVKLDIPETLPPLRVDAMQVQQVFRNLISNAVDAMPEGGTLVISAVENKSDQTVTIAVRDTGTGIPPEMMDKLFQPLFTTKARGIGLGLVVVKNLSQANGGTVAVESEVGKGSVFSVTLPSAG